MIDDPDFSLDLGHSWERVPDEDPRLYKLFEATHGTTIVIRAMTVGIAPHQMDEMTDLLLDMRISGERERAATAGLDTVIYEPIVAPQPWGRAAAFYGHDQTGRQFGFSACITPRRVIGLYMSSNRLSELELVRTMDEVNSKIGFDRTPLKSSAFD